MIRIADQTTVIWSTDQVNTENAGAVKEECSRSKMLAILYFVQKVITNIGFIFPVYVLSAFDFSAPCIEYKSRLSFKGRNSGPTAMYLSITYFTISSIDICVTHFERRLICSTFCICLICNKNSKDCNGCTGCKRLVTCYFFYELVLSSLVLISSGLFLYVLVFLDQVGKLPMIFITIHIIIKLFQELF
jgi:hypothetical protein